MHAATYDEASANNKYKLGKKLSVFAWGIVPKIREIDDAITPDHQKWTYEVHPEVCFWALSGGSPMQHRKKLQDGADERLALLRTVFPLIDVTCPPDPLRLARAPAGCGYCCPYGARVVEGHNTSGLRPGACDKGFGNTENHSNFQPAASFATIKILNLHY